MTCKKKSERVLLKTNIEEGPRKSFLNESFMGFLRVKPLENVAIHKISEENFPEKQRNSFKKFESALSVIGLAFLLFLCQTEQCRTLAIKKRTD